MTQSHRRSACFAAGLVLALLACAGAAVAASQRTFVSTSGVDNPTCSLVAPCRAFTAALAATNPGGEVIVLDSGGYGPVTITKSVSIIAPAGVYAGISVFSGDGIAITTPATTDKVVLQGLTINNQGSSGNGIHFDGAGRLEVARTRITGFQFPAVGLNFVPAAGEGRLHAVDLSVAASNIGVYVGGGSFASGTVYATLERVDLSGNDYGLSVYDWVRVVTADSAFTGNVVQGILVFNNGGTVALVSVDRCTVSNNGEGVAAQGNGASYVTISGSTIANNTGSGLINSPGLEMRLAGTTIAQNATGISGSGVVLSQGNNFIYGNISDGPAPTVVGSK